ncbi:ATP-binding protein [Pseudonocardia sp. GCM10023141]|uniref:ATP-binding protein n=1 Tax=Pseudonocardia sp. GCM10023141 TaxID=3252653 RepID=UPI0036089562
MNASRSESAVPDDTAVAALREGSPLAAAPAAPIPAAPIPPAPLLAAAGADLVHPMVGEHELADARTRLHAWATAVGLSSDVVADVVLAGYEAMANAVEHAYQGEGRHVELCATCTGDGFATVSVRDRGRWRPPPADPELRGRGLILIRELADEVEIDQGAAGTSVLMRWRLPTAIS